MLRPRRALLRRASALLVAITFVGAGLLHLIVPDAYVRIMPPYLPAPLALVIVSGLAEMLLGVLVLPRNTRSLAGWGLVALLVAVFPANLHMALHADQFDGLSARVLWARLPLQAVLMAWVWWSTRPPKNQPDRRSE